jgi:magnesium-protoporphyrin IX monomethyl ester (oxidative) cyclase
MKILLVNPRLDEFTTYLLRFEPLGLMLVASSLRSAGHDVRLLDLQFDPLRNFISELDSWRPDAVGISLNFLPTTPEAIELAKTTKARLPKCFVFVGGHSASFLAEEVLEHADGAIDCVQRGEGEIGAPKLLEAYQGGDIRSAPGAVTLAGAGPAPPLLKTLDDYLPARDIIQRRNRFKYHIFGKPCASIEFSRGCPWDCTFCSAWTFFGRSYRKVSPDSAVRDLSTVKAPNVLLVDDVAFVHPEHGLELGKAVEKSGIRKRYIFETRADVLLRNPHVFEYWVRLGLHGLFLGFEAFDEEELKALRKRVSPNKNFEALEVAHRIGIPEILVNIIVDPNWDEKDFKRLEDSVKQLPKYVNLHFTVKTPYPGTEIWHTESRELTTLDYRLFDSEHSVLPTRLPLQEFYKNLDNIYYVAARSKIRMTWQFTKTLGQLFYRGQPKACALLMKIGVSKLLNQEDWRGRAHRQSVEYQMKPPGRLSGAVSQHPSLYVHLPTVPRHPEANSFPAGTGF